MVYFSFSIWLGKKSQILFIGQFYVAGPQNTQLHKGGDLRACLAWEGRVRPSPWPVAYALASAQSGPRPLAAISSSLSPSHSFCRQRSPAFQQHWLPVCASRGPDASRSGPRSCASHWQEPSPRLVPPQHWGVYSHTCLGAIPRPQPPPGPLCATAGFFFLIEVKFV